MIKKSANFQSRFKLITSNGNDDVLWKVNTVIVLCGDIVTLR